MEILFQIAALQEEFIMVKGKYGSDFEPYDECLTALRVLDEFDDEAAAILELPKYSAYGNNLTILKVYKFK